MGREDQRCVVVRLVEPDSSGMKWHATCDRSIQPSRKGARLTNNMLDLLVLASRWCYCTAGAEPKLKVGELVRQNELI